MATEDNRMCVQKGVQCQEERVVPIYTVPAAALGQGGSRLTIEPLSRVMSNEGQLWSWLEEVLNPSFWLSDVVLVDNIELSGCFHKICGETSFRKILGSGHLKNGFQSMTS